MYEKLYENITDALVQDGYIVLQDALEDTLACSLLESAKKQQSYKTAGISSASRVDKKRRSDKIRWLDASDAAQREYLAFIEGLQNYLNRHLFLGLRYYEAHFAKYEVGDFYEKHLDAFEHSKNRVVTSVYYLNESWTQKDGGALLIYDEENKLLKRVLPLQNTLVIFLSERFVHEVQAACKVRYSIAGWFRVDKF